MAPVSSLEDHLRRAQLRLHHRFEGHHQLDSISGLTNNEAQFGRCGSGSNQVKRLLKEKKLEQLVDSDLNGNYDEEEVEQLIQVTLVCTQHSAMERSKMSEIVRMLEGNGLAERWEEWQKKEMSHQDFNHHHSHPNTNVDCTSHIALEELSNPR